MEILQVGRSLPLQGPLHPFEGKKCQGRRGSRWELRACGDPVPTVVHLRPQPCGWASETDVSSCGRCGKWDTQRGEEHCIVAATEEPGACSLRLWDRSPVSLASSRVAEGKGASAVTPSLRTLGDQGAAPALPERTALQALWLGARGRVGSDSQLRGCVRNHCFGLGSSEGCFAT